MGHRRSGSKLWVFTYFEDASVREACAHQAWACQGCSQSKGVTGLQKADQVLVLGGKQGHQRPASQHLGEGNRKSSGQRGRGSGFQLYHPALGFRGSVSSLFREDNVGVSGEGGEAMFVQSLGYQLYPQCPLPLALWGAALLHSRNLWMLTLWRACFNHFMCINSLNPQNNTIPYKLVLSAFYKWEGTERLSNLPKVTQLVSGGAGIWRQAVWLELLKTK